jgi:hypothetical protein
MKYSRIVNNTAVDTRSDSPVGFYTENIANEFVVVPDEVMAGWSNSSGAWLAPVPPPEATPEEIAAREAAAAEAARLAAVPREISPRQIRQALTALSLRDQVENAVAASSTDIKDWWEFSTSVERDNEHVIAMAVQLGVTDRQLDDLFTLAGTL